MRAPNTNKKLFKVFLSDLTPLYVLGDSEEEVKQSIGLDCDITYISVTKFRKPGIGNSLQVIATKQQLVTVFQEAERMIHYSITVNDGRYD